MNDEWFLFKVTDSNSPWHFLIVQGDNVMLKLTHVQARQVQRLLNGHFDPGDKERGTFDRT